jgi:hypothetical protein
MKSAGGPTLQNLQSWILHAARNCYVNVTKEVATCKFINASRFRCRQYESDRAREWKVACTSRVVICLAS